jgi:hypothetical protein
LVFQPLLAVILLIHTLFPLAILFSSERTLFFCPAFFSHQTSTISLGKAEAEAAPLTQAFMIYFDDSRFIYFFLFCFFLSIFAIAFSNN